MKYIVCKEPKRFELGEKAAPERVAGEALLKVNKVGICGTDLHAYTGNQAFFTYPRILGHELATSIIEIDSSTHGLKAGDKAVVMPYVSCGKCIACRNGKTNCCTNIKVLGVHTDGGMQEYITVPERLLLPAGNLTDDQMAIVEPLAIGAHAIRRAGLQTGENIVVVGCGPIGIGIMKLAQIAGANVIAIDTNPQRLEYASRQIGVTHTVLAGPEAANQVAEITDKDMATAVFDATGHKGALESGVQYMAHGGRYVLVGLSKGTLSFEHPAIHAKETTLMCSRNATTEDFQHVIDTMEKGLFPTASFITHNVSMIDMISQFDQWLDPSNQVMKATVDF